MNLSICIVTYNHCEYIKDCLDGILLQKFDFEYEILIFDDCSTDDTVLICHDYQKKFPNLFKIYSNINNVGMAHNFYNAISSCNGDLIAICEGDDFWTHDNKLITQYNYMRDNFDCNLTFHDVEIIGSNKSADFYFNYDSKDMLNFEDILVSHQIPTCSMMIRKSAFLNKITNIFFSFPVCDIPLHLLLVQDGYAFHFREKFAVYRINDSSITNNRNKSLDRYLRMIKMYWHLFFHFKFRNGFIFNFKILRLCLGYIKDLISNFLKY